MEIARALVLAGSTPSEHLWPSAPVGPKHLVPIGNRPILFHSLQALRDAGLLEVTIGLDPSENGETKAAVGDGTAWDLQVDYVDYVAGVGVAGALAGNPRSHAEPLIVQHGDALLREPLTHHVKRFAREDLDVLAIRLNGRAGAEEPEATAGYLLSPRGISMLVNRPVAHRDPVAAIRAQGGDVGEAKIDGCLPCHGDQAALLHTNRFMLERLTPEVSGALLHNCEIQGSVVVHPTARLQRTIVRGPAIIGPNCQLTDAYVGPFTSVGAGVTIEGAEIEHSIVLDGAEIRFVGARLESSVIGRGARVVRGFRLPSALRICIGDGAEIGLS